MRQCLIRKRTMHRSRMISNITEILVIKGTKNSNKQREQSTHFTIDCLLKQQRAYFARHRRKNNRLIHDQCEKIKTKIRWMAPKLNIDLPHMACTVWAFEISTVRRDAWLHMRNICRYRRTEKHCHVYGAVAEGRSLFHFLQTIFSMPRY